MLTYALTAGMQNLVPREKGTSLNRNSPICHFPFYGELQKDSYDVCVKNASFYAFFTLLPSCSLIAYTEQYVEYDPLITPAEPSNPWISDDITLWDIEMR